MIQILHYIQHSGIVKEVTEKSFEKLQPMLEKLAFMFHHNFYPRPKIDLKDADILQNETIQ